MVTRAHGDAESPEARTGLACSRRARRGKRAQSSLARAGRGGKNPFAHHRLGWTEPARNRFGSELHRNRLRAGKRVTLPEGTEMAMTPQETFAQAREKLLALRNEQPLAHETFLWPFFRA